VGVESATNQKEVIMDQDQLVSSVGELKRNVDTLAGFASGSHTERRFHRARIKNGKNFVAVRGSVGVRFSPSKFAGYLNNGLHHTDRLQERDGRVTDVHISKLIGKPLEVNHKGYAEIDREYETYCSAHGIIPSRHPRTRRYWVL
jgi:hypothetical protein